MTVLLKFALSITSSIHPVIKKKTMKKHLLAAHILFLVVCLLSASGINAQIWKRVKDEVKNRAANKAVNTSGNATDAAIDRATQRVGNLFSGKNENGSTGKTPEETKTSHQDKASFTAYKNYDFTPGDKIIFEQDLSREPDAELPARFSLIRGSAEIQSDEGEKFLHLDQGASALVAPLMNSDHYLPEQFTLEFDLMYETEADRFAYVNDFVIAFYARGNNSYGGSPLYRFDINNNSRSIWGNNNSYQDFPAPLQKSVSTPNTWHHVAIYVHKNIGKAYIDGYRVAVSNTLPAGAGNLALISDVHYGMKIKNFRLAAGGDDKYQKIITDGKFITHGILFDVGQATIQPESTGTLNEVARLMKDHPDLRFEIDGHTDSDGNAEANLKLSERRAAAVRDKLIEMGIDGSRLTTKGFGSGKPIDSNDTAEGKANNRRVEFVKI
jgi:outer membrane protein OmpA-like peptidoglycan-associated protein